MHKNQDFGKAKECIVCGLVKVIKHKYCPYCGAKLTDKQE